MAIELAAAWTPVLSSEEISQEIARSVDFLATNLRDIPERHRSLRAVFDYSWNMLSGEERDLLSRLSVFKGGFRREAAEQGAGATLPLLSSLLAKSFLRRSPLGRYEMHELLRQYAGSKLREATDKRELNEVDARNRHCHYYADFVQSREEKSRGKEQLSARQEITVDIENVREAWRWAVEQGKWEEIEKMVGGLWFFYEIGGFFQEADLAYEQAAIAVTPAGLAGLTRGVEGEVSFGSSEETRHRAIVLGKILARRGGMVGLRMGRVQEGSVLLERSLRLFRQFDERKEMAFSLNILGSIARSLCQYERAKEYFQKSLDVSREVGDRWASAYSLSDLGNVAFLVGRYDEARRLHVESLRISRETSDWRASMFCLNDSTSVAIALGEYEMGMHSCREALAMAREIGHRWGEATAVYQMGVISCYTGKYAEAGGLLQESLAAFEEMGDLQRATLPLQHLGYLAYLRKEYAQAQHLLQQAVSICQDVGYPRGSAAALNGLGKAAYGLGEVEAARLYLQEALRIAMGIEAWPVVMDIVVSIGGNGGKAFSSKTEQMLNRRILSLAYNHPATENHTREEARGLLAEYSETDLAEIDAVPGQFDPTISLQQIVEEYGLGQEHHR